MTTLTIPKELTRERELVAVPLKNYKEFLERQKRIKSRREFNSSTAERKALLRARKNIVRGNYLTLEELRNALGAKN